MEAYAYNNLNQISSAGYAYDQWGNMVMTPDAQYAYDLKNRLVKVTKKDGTVIDYAYDAMDQRISSTVNGGKKTEFLMTGMVEYARKEDNKALYHTLGLDLAGSLYRTGAVGAVLASGDMSYLYDGNGNVIGVMQDGKITHKLAYEPFGKQTTNVNLPFTFSTKSVDSSDMSYYGFRFYSASNSRWINRDPIGERGGWNIYSMVSNNNLSAVDIRGLIDVVLGTYFTVDCPYSQLNTEVARLANENKIDGKPTTGKFAQTLTWKYSGDAIKKCTTASDSSCASKCKYTCTYSRKVEFYPAGNKVYIWLPEWKQYAGGRQSANDYAEKYKDDPEKLQAEAYTTLLAKLAAWDAFRNAIDAHEQGHYTIAKKYYGDIEIIGTGADCTKGTAESGAVEDFSNKLNNEFSKRDKDANKEQNDYDSKNSVSISFPQI